MSYQPRHGEDYLVNYYDFLNVDPSELDIENKIKEALRKKTREYHPDRLEGMAEELRERGELVIRVANEARRILLNQNNKSTYDEILENWNGPVSHDGTPIIDVDQLRQKELAQMDPNKLESGMLKMREQINAMTGASADNIEIFADMIANLGDDTPERVRAAYDEALLSMDRALAIEQTNRGALLGLAPLNEKRYEAELGYGEKILNEIESARATKLDQLQKQALGGVGVRLAIMAGEITDDSKTLEQAEVKLPCWYDAQAKKVTELATQREEILKKRLENYTPSYPEAEAQSTASADLIVKIEGAVTFWLRLKYNSETNSADQLEITENLQDKLDAGDYLSAIQDGHSIIIVKPLEHIGMQTLLEEAINKHFTKLNTNEA